MQPDFGGRTVAFKALVGSHNYNLNDETSDRDYKYFVFPNFDDLYDNKYFALPSQTSAELDFDVHDVRQLPKLFYKANINFLEVLYSKELEFGGISLIGNDYKYTPSEIQEIFAMRDKISRMNLPYLYHACKGMHFNKMSMIKKGTAGTKHLVEKFGYDTKQALHAYRVLDFCERLVYTNFSFKDAMTYSGALEQSDMFEIKYGHFSFDEYLNLIDNKMKKFLTLEVIFDKINTDEETYSRLKDLVRDSVKSTI